jgi:hypothetical protein
MTTSDNREGLVELNDRELDEVVSRGDLAKSERRIRLIEKLIDAPCDCDRYTCTNCRSLQALGYDYRTYVRRAKGGVPTSPLPNLKEGKDETC